MSDETTTQPATSGAEGSVSPPTSAAQEAPVPTEGTGAEASEPTQAGERQLDPADGMGDDLRAALAEAERLRDEYLEQAQRSRAEFQNLRRRSDEALAASLDRGAERLLAQLLPVLDNFGYVVDAASEEEETPLAKGLHMVHGELMAALQAVGLEPIPGAGATFDPTVHDALLSEESDQAHDEPVVVEVLRPGYRFKGRTLRPASVKVVR